jgi:hypothetical protein
MDPSPEAASAPETVIAGVLVGVSLVTFLLLRVTTKSNEGDFFDSPGYWATWLLFPLIGLVATLFRPSARTAFLAGLALVGPLMAILFVSGTFGHDPNDGASFWIVGEILLVIEGLFAVVGGLVAVVIAKAAALRQRRAG